MLDTGMLGRLAFEADCYMAVDTILIYVSVCLVFCVTSVFTGMAGYWLRDEDRSTPYPTPIDVMIKASTLAMKSHESIPGIWLQETDKVRGKLEPERMQWG